MQSPANQTPRTFALIPAAGHSRRMGAPKLLLPLAGRPLIARVIAAWRQSRVDHVVVVVRPDDTALADVVRSSGVELVVPMAPPPDMKASLQAALWHVEHHHHPTEADAFLVAPADMPRLSSAVMDLLINQHRIQPERILVPTLAGRRGHPVLFPWPLAAEVHTLAADEGFNALVDCHDPLLIPCDDLLAGQEDPFADIDTPGDYGQMIEEPKNRRTQ
jgi:molybdenum cofactor cytidylyltransferase